MRILKRIYKENIYGVIGTLLFHILLVGTFLLAEINQKNEVTEEAILIEFPEELPPEEPEPEPEQSENPESSPQVNDPSARQNQANQLTNRAANRSATASRNDFFDEAYQQEIENAQKLVSHVNKQLSQKIVNLDDIPMPEQTTEGMDRESIKNVIYTGESNIEYQLENRYHLRLPIPVYLAKGGGTVIVDISVNREGRVVSAKPRKSSTVRDEEIYLYAQAAAQRTLFNSDPNAPAIQNGTIKYNFIAQ